MKTKSCEHLDNLIEIEPSLSSVCEECEKTGSKWVHLRTCQTCGVTLCCDSSPNKHATQHFHSTQHAVISSAEPGERWLWCYVDKSIKKY